MNRSDWIEWPSKQVRDAAWAKLMNDDRLGGWMEEHGMDGKRMMFGVFPRYSTIEQDRYDDKPPWYPNLVRIADQRRGAIQSFLR